MLILLLLTTEVLLFLISNFMSVVEIEVIISYTKFLFLTISIHVAFVLLARLPHTDQFHLKLVFLSVRTLTGMVFFSLSWVIAYLLTYPRLEVLIPVIGIMFFIGIGVLIYTVLQFFIRVTFSHSD